MAGEGKRGKRAWLTDEWADQRTDWVNERADWAITQARECVEKQPWAAVVLAQVWVEVLIAGIVHALTRLQEPALRRWIERFDVGTLSRDQDIVMLDALIAKTGESIAGDADVWRAFREHVNRRNAFIHSAEQPTVEEAKASLAACQRFVDRLIRLYQEQVGVTQ